MQPYVSLCMQSMSPLYLLLCHVLSSPSPSSFRCSRFRYRGRRRCPHIPTESEREERPGQIFIFYSSLAAPVLRGCSGNVMDLLLSPKLGHCQLIVPTNARALADSRANSGAQRERERERGRERSRLPYAHQASLCNHSPSARSALSPVLNRAILLLSQSDLHSLMASRRHTGSSVNPNVCPSGVGS